MAKLTLTDVENIAGNPVAAANAINAAFAAIEVAFENTVSLDGTTPNSMDAQFDLDSNRIINLGAPSSATDAARLQDITDQAVFPELVVPSQSGHSGQVLSTNGSTLEWQSASDLALPDQSGNSGKVLKSNGTDASWATIDSVLPTQTSNSGKFLTTNGTTASWGNPHSVPRRTSGFADGECTHVSGGLTLNTSDMAAGYTFSVLNISGSDFTLTQGAGVTLYRCEDATTGNRTVAARSLVTIRCESGTEAYVVGTSA